MLRSILTRHLVAASACTSVFFVGMAAVLLYVGKGDKDVEQYCDEDEEVRKKIEQKLKLRKRALEAGSGRAGSDKHGLPHGQVPVKKWIVLDLGKRPKPIEYSLENSGACWSLLFTVNGSTKACDQVSLSLQDIMVHGLRDYSNHNWHCVTGWTASNLNFKGISLRELLGIVEKRIKDNGGLWDSNWKYLLQSSPDGYSVPVFREDAMRNDDRESFLAILYEDVLIPMEHGGPRFVFPSLFGWKSCKWLSHVNLSHTYEKGFWERIGCHARGRVALDERWAPNASSVWIVLSTQNQIFAAIFGEQIWIRVMQKSGHLLGFFVDSIKHLLSLKNSD